MDSESLNILERIDLRGVPCPLNFIRISLLMEKLRAKESLLVELDRGEPEESISLGLKEAGHQIQILEKNPRSMQILVICGNDK